MGQYRSFEQVAFLHLQKTADLLMNELAQALKPSELTPTQYNVLRILRSAGADGLACGRIAERMINREPDMTRLLDRLEGRGLIERRRDQRDRRVVRSWITSLGGELLAGLDNPVQALAKRQFSHLGRDRLKNLTKLLEEVRERTG